MPPSINARFATANYVLSVFASDTEIAHASGHVVVAWGHSRGRHRLKRWMCRGQDFYPVWYRQWPHGGTACTALSQLCRWVKDRPVLPLATWQYWGSAACRLFRDRNEDVIRALKDGGYPTVAKCVLCSRDLTQSLDWWHLDKTSGPCCRHTEGCRQATPKNHLCIIDGRMIPIANRTDA